MLLTALVTVFPSTSLKLMCSKWSSSHEGWLPLTTGFFFRSVHMLQLHRARSSAVGGEFACPAHPISGSWFGFPAQFNQAFRPFRSGEVVSGLSRKDRALTCQSAGHRKPL